MKKKRYLTAADGSCSWTDGSLMISRYDWCNKPWRARWTDIFGAVHTVEEYTRFRLFSRLRVHGIEPVVLGRRVKK